MATSSKFTKKTLSVLDLTVDKDLNVRLKDQYDIPQMRDSILSAGRINNPISVEKLKEKDNGKVVYKVLRGNRRTWAGQELMADPTTPQEVKDALAKVEVLIYEDLDETQRMSLVVDHDQKSLSKTEVILTVWRLTKSMFSEKDIASMLYFLLANFTGRTDKLSQVPERGAERATYLQKWFHGTLGNYIMAVQRMPQYVQDSFLMYYKVQDGILPSKTTVIPVKLTQSRVTALTKARVVDEDNGKWDYEKGGPAFIDQWAKFEKADKDGTGDDKVERPSVTMLKDRAGAMKSEVVRKTLLSATGERQSDLAELDERTYRETKVFEVLYAASGNARLKPEFADLVKAMIQGDLKKVEEMVATSAQAEPNAA